MRIYEFLDERFKKVEFGPDFISVIEQNIEKNYSSRRQVCLLNKNERQRRRLLFYGTGNDCFDCLSFSDARPILFLKFPPVELELSLIFRTSFRQFET